MDVHRIQVLRYCLPQSVSDSGLFYNHIAARLVPTLLQLCVCLCESDCEREHVWIFPLAVDAGNERQRSSESEGGESKRRGSFCLNDVGSFSGGVEDDAQMGASYPVVF